MQIDGTTFVFYAVPVISGIVWLVRLEGRINVTDSRYLDIISRLTRIETKQDTK